MIDAIENFHEFDYDIQQKTLESGDECTKRIIEVTKTIDAIMDSDDMPYKISMFTKLGNTNYEIIHGDLMFFVADVFTMGVQYGTRT